MRVDCICFPRTLLTRQYMYIHVCNFRAQLISGYNTNRNYSVSQKSRYIYTRTMNNSRGMDPPIQEGAVVSFAMDPPIQEGQLSVSGEKNVQKY